MGLTRAQREIAPQVPIEGGLEEPKTTAGGTAGEYYTNKLRPDN